jgi:hypothetical protein
MTDEHDGPGCLWQVMAATGFAFWTFFMLSCCCGGLL